MANVHIRVPSQCGAGREIKSGVPLLRLLRDGVGMVEGRGYREIPGPPASMELVGLGVQLVQLLALQGRYLKCVSVSTLTQPRETSLLTSWKWTTLAILATTTTGC
jgi:hypothetical protein